MNKKVVHKIVGYPKIKRLDMVVAKLVQVSRNQAQKMIIENLVLVNNKAMKSNYSIREGDNIEVIQKKPEKNKIPKIKTIYEDNEIIVINKPAGISVHPASGEKQITISEIFSKKLPYSDNDIRSGVVHRLDKGTSGVMILAKNKESQVFLKNAFKKRTIKKTYFAFVEGRLIPSEGVIKIPLKRETVKREKIGVSSTGKYSITKYKVKKYFLQNSLVELKPGTGRTHQIRVHLSSIGFPVVGDKKYGKKGQLSDGIKLHAYSIEFVHPKTKQKLKFVSPLTNDFKSLLNKKDWPN